MNINSPPDTSPRYHLATPDSAPHPLADLFPPMTDEEYQALKEDIARNGHQLPIVLYEGMVLDGCHRLRACKELGIEPEFEEWSPRLPGCMCRVSI